MFLRNFLRCRRGSAAFATVIALVPLIGAVGLGAEAGSWYITKQHAQNAADAAASSGALRLACTISGSSSCDTQNVDYRGKEFAAQNTFLQQQQHHRRHNQLSRTSLCDQPSVGGVANRKDRSWPLYYRPVDGRIGHHTAG
jgi:Flp pilus assembly protein TadG